MMILKAVERRYLFTVLLGGHVNDARALDLTQMLDDHVQAFGALGIIAYALNA